MRLAKWGDVSVELDALPPGVLRRRIAAEIGGRVDLNELRRVRECGHAKRQQLRDAVQWWGRRRAKPPDEPAGRVVRAGRTLLAGVSPHIRRSKTKAWQPAADLVAR